MNCKKCGSLLTESDQFCKNCGTAVSTRESGVGAGANMNGAAQPVTPNNNVNMNRTAQPVMPNNNVNMNRTTQPATPNNGVNMNGAAQPATPNNGANMNGAAQPVTPNNNVNMNRTAQPVTPNNGANMNGAAQPATPNNNVNMNGTVQPVTPNNNVNMNRTAQPTTPNNGANMNGGQPAWVNGYNPQPGYTPPKNNSGSNAKYIILGIGIVVIIMAIVFGLSLLVGKEKKSESSIGTGSSEGTQTTNTSSYKVNFDGFTFNIPNNIMYEAGDDAVYFGDEDEAWAAQMEIEEGDFSKIKANKAAIQTVLQQSGVVATAAIEKNIGGVEYITIEITAAGQNAIIAMAELDSGSIAGFTIVTQDNDINYSILEQISPIIKSAKRSGTTTNIESLIKIDMEALAELAK